MQKPKFPKWGGWLLASIAGLGIISLTSIALTAILTDYKGSVEMEVNQRGSRMKINGGREKPSNTLPPVADKPAADSSRTNKSAADK